MSRNPRQVVKNECLLGEEGKEMETLAWARDPTILEWQWEAVLSGGSGQSSSARSPDPRAGSPARELSDLG